MRSSVASSLAILLALALPACSPRSTARGGADPAYSLESYCAVASTPGLFDWTGGALVACPGLASGGSDDPVDGSSCTVSTIDAQGQPHTTSYTNVRGAQVLADGRVLVWSFDGSLSIRGSSGAMDVAAVALDPWLDASRNRIAYIAPAAGATAIEAGDDRRVVVYDVPSASELEVAADATASAPVIVPGTNDVLYVSSAGDVAAVFRATASVAAADPEPDSCTGGREGDPTDPNSACTPPDTTAAFVQLTNTTPEIPQTTVPAFGRQHVFVGENDTARLVFAAPVETDSGTVSEIFALDPRTGETTDLGPGAFPQRGPQGSVLARTGDTSCVAVQYLAPGAQP